MVKNQPVERDDSEGATSLPLQQAEALAGQAAELAKGGNVQAGAGLLDQAIDVVASQNRIDLHAFFLTRKGNLLAQGDRPDEGLRAFEEALALARKADHPRLLEEVRSRRGLVFVELGRVKEGLDDLAAALEHAEDRDDVGQAFRLLSLMGDAHRMAGDEAQSEVSYERAIALAETADEPINTFAVRLGLGQARLAAGKPTEAIDALLPALELAKEDGDEIEEHRVLTTLSEAYFELDQREALLETTRRLVVLAESHRDHREAIAQRENLITVLLSLDLLDEALVEIERALAYARRRGPRERVLVHLLNKGRVNYELGSYAIAEDIYKEALELAEAQENRRAVPTILGRLGALYAEMGDLEASLRYAELAVTKAVELEDPAILAEQSILLAMTHQDLGENDKARNAAARAKQAYEAAGELTLAARATALVDEIGAAAPPPS
jgi:tetratricopeptide (TPR) repeat protein